MQKRWFYQNWLETKRWIFLKYVGADVPDGPSKILFFAKKISVVPIPFPKPQKFWKGLGKIFLEIIFREIP